MSNVSIGSTVEVRSGAMELLNASDLATNLLFLKTVKRYRNSDKPYKIYNFIRFCM